MNTQMVPTVKYLRSFLVAEIRCVRASTGFPHYGDARSHWWMEMVHGSSYGVRVYSSAPASDALQYEK